MRSFLLNFFCFGALCTLCIGLAACAGQRREAYRAALAAPIPPADFSLSVTVLKAPADTASRAAAYLRAPVATRPARYIVEPDRVLRVALGSGAADTTFPTATRQLTEGEFASIWRTLQTSSLVSADHPAMVSRGPDAAEIGVRTLYVVAFNTAGVRRVFSIEAEPTAASGADEAGRMVEQLAGLAWQK